MKISNSIGEMKVTYKTTSMPKQKLISSYQMYEFLREIWDYDLIEYQEQVCLICLSRQNYVIGYEFISTGGTAGTVVDAKMIFQAALLCNASSIMVAHNHPSGNLNPSDADIKVTKRLFESGKMLDIPLLDHMIITRDNFTSFADRGILY